MSARRGSGPKRLRTSRRSLLGALGVLPALGVVAGSAAGGESKEKAAADTRPALVTRADQEEYARLKALDLTAPEVVARQKKMPVGLFDFQVEEDAALARKCASAAKGRWRAWA